MKLARQPFVRSDNNVSIRVKSILCSQLTLSTDNSITQLTQLTQFVLKKQFSRWFAVHYNLQFTACVCCGLFALLLKTAQNGCKKCRGQSAETWEVGGTCPKPTSCPLRTCCPHTKSHKLHSPCIKTPLHLNSLKLSYSYTLYPSALYYIIRDVRLSCLAN